MVSLVPPPTTTKTKKRATPVESKKKTKAAPPQPKDESTEDKKTSKEDNNEANELSAEDIAFEKLLNSQRDILARLDFGNASNSSELQFVEGPDNLPLVSPHSSASEFHLSYEFEYDYHCQQQQEQFEFEQQQQAFLQSQAAGYPTHQGYPYHHQHHKSSAPTYEPPRHQRRYEHCQYAGADAPPSCGGNNFPRDSTHSVGVGDDRFILDQIQIGPKGGTSTAAAASVFDDTFDNSNVQRRRKRETEQELMDTFHGSSSHHHRRTSNKKRRSGGASAHCKSTPSTDYDDLLPVPSDLNDLDNDDDNASTASLLLDDLDFPSMHGNESSPPLTTTKTNTKEAAVTTTTTTFDKPVVKMVDDEEASTSSTTRRSSRNLWKPRQRHSSSASTPSEVTAAGLSIQDQRAMWKPRKSSSSSVMMNDSCASIQVDDLAAQQEKDLTTPTGEQAKAASEVVEV